MKRIYVLLVFVALAVFAKAALVDPISATSISPNKVVGQPVEPDDDLAQTVSKNFVISQAYPGGGGSTGTYLFDYVELKNISGIVQSLGGLSLMYGSATGQFGSNSNVFALPNANLGPGQYYLVQLGSTGTAGVAFPVTADATSPNLSMEAAGGKVALVTSAFALSGCGATATPCTLPRGTVVDLVSWGVSNNGEGATLTNGGVALTSTQGNVRKNAGCTDNDNNNADFDIISNPVPRNSSTAANPCAGAVSPNRLFTTRMNGAMEAPTPNASTARGYGTVVLNETENIIIATFFWEGLGSGTTAGHIHTGAVGIAGPVTFNMTPPIGVTSGSMVRAFNVTPAQVADFRSGNTYFNIHTTNFGGGEIRGQLVSNLSHPPADFNGDGKTDFGLIRFDATPGHLGWFTRLNGPDTISLREWGLNSDQPTPADYDGDGKTDIAVWRQGGPTGTNTDTSGFYIFRSSDSTFSYIRFGQAADDVSVTADYTGDGKADPAIYRSGDQGSAPGVRNQSVFWFFASSGPQVGKQVAVAWGLGPDSVDSLNGDHAYPGDFDGDGKADFCVFRAATSAATAQAVFITALGDGAGGGTPTGVYQPFGKVSDDFFPGDYDGDGKTDLAFARIEGTRLNWFYLPSSGGPAVVRNWGASTDFAAPSPCPGDYDGDGKTDFAFFRTTPSSGSFFFYLGTTSGPAISPPWGKSGDIPVNNDFH